MKIKFDYMKFHNISENRLIFKSQTSDTVYYFEFSLRYLLNLFSGVKYIGFPKIFKK